MSFLWNRFSRVPFASRFFCFRCLSWRARGTEIYARLTERILSRCVRCLLPQLILPNSLTDVHTYHRTLSLNYLPIRKLARVGKGPTPFHFNQKV